MAKLRKPTKHERIADIAAKALAHANSYTINSKIRVLQFEAEELDASVIAMSAALVRIKERRAVVAATIEGFAAVVAKR